MSPFIPRVPLQSSYLMLKPAKGILGLSMMEALGKPPKALTGPCGPLQGHTNRMASSMMAVWTSEGL